MPDFVPSAVGMLVSQNYLDPQKYVNPNYLQFYRLYLLIRFRV